MKQNSSPHSPSALFYPLHVQWSEEDQAYLGSVPGLIGNCCHAATPEETLTQLKDIADDLVTYLTKQGKSLPLVPKPSNVPDPKVIRLALGLSQVKFSHALGISPKTHHKWEQGTSRPSGAARTLLRIAAMDPGTVKRALAG